MLLVKEAGGHVSEPNGKKWEISSTDILASNFEIHQKIQENLNT